MSEKASSWFVNLNGTDTKLGPTRTLHSTLVSPHHMNSSQDQAVGKRKRPGGIAITISTSDEIGMEGEKAKEVVCAECRCRYEATVKALVLYQEIFLRSKELFLQDTLHHHSEEELWARLFRTLGGVEESYSLLTKTTDH